MLGLLPQDVEALTIPEMERLYHGMEKRRHFEALRLQWFAIFLVEAVRRGVHNGYLEARAAMANGRVERPSVDLLAQLDKIPGFDKSMVPKRRRRR